MPRSSKRAALFEHICCSISLQRSARIKRARSGLPRKLHTRVECCVLLQIVSFKSVSAGFEGARDVEEIKMTKAVTATGNIEVSGGVRLGLVERPRWSVEDCRRYRNPCRTWNTRTQTRKDTTLESNDFD